MKEKSPSIRILTIRNQKVVLDADLAAVYGVTTRRLNEQLRRNRKRFPSDFTFQLTADDHLAGSVNAMNLKDRFGDVETDCRNRLHG